MSPSSEGQQPPHSCWSRIFSNGPQYTSGKKVSIDTCRPVSRSKAVIVWRERMDDRFHDSAIGTFIGPLEDRHLWLRYVACVLI